MKKLILTIVITAFAGTSYADTQTFSQIGDEQAFNAALSAIKQTPHTDAIAEAIFDNQFALAALSPEEMNETEGAFAWGTLGQGMLTGAATSATVNHALHYAMHGQVASLESTALALGIGAITGGRGAYPAAAGVGGEIQQLGTTVQRLISIRAAATEAAINFATFPYENSN